MMLSRIVVLVLAGLVLAMAALHITGSGPRVEVTLPPQSIAHDEGQRYRAPLPIGPALGAVVAYDSMLDFGASRALLKEDGVAIGRGHSDHAGIARDGGGRFSHWDQPTGQRIFFSSSDGSDPRSNGRVYAVELQLLPPVWLLVVAGALLGWLGARAAVPWIVPAAVLLVIGLAVAWISIFWGAVLISPDSAAYITFHPWYPLGYPTFIQGVSQVIGYEKIPVVQIVILSISSLFLSFYLVKVSGSLSVGAISAIIFIGHAPLMMYAGYILTETIYTSLLFVFLGLGISLLIKFRSLSSVIFVLVGVLAWAVRPSGSFLLFVVAYVAVLLAPQIRFKSIITWMIIPAVGAIGMVLIVHHAVRGPGAPSQAGRLIFGQVAFLFDPADASQDDRVIAGEIFNALAPHRSQFDAQAGWVSKHSFSVNNYSERVTDVDRVLYQRSNLKFFEGEAILIRLSINTIINNPLSYLKWVAEDVWWAWWTKILYSIRSGPQNGLADYSADEAGRRELIDRFSLAVTESQVSLDEDAAAGPAGQFIDLVRRCFALIFMLPGLVPALGAALLIAAFVGPFSSSILLRCLGLIGVTVHLSVAMTSAATLFLVRYALPTDPLVIAGLVLMIHGVLEWFRQRRRRVQPSSEGASVAPIPQVT